MGRRHRARHRTGRHYATMTSVTGTHRAVGKRRGIAAWPIVCVVLVAFLVAGWFGWHWADGVLESRAAAQAADCKQGDLPLRVTVDPALEEPVMAAASRWNEERTVVREHCVRVVVHTASPDDVYAVLTDDADPTTIGGSPAAWLPDSTEWVEKLARDRPELVGSSGLSLASGPDGDYPFLVIAGDDATGAQQHAAQSFQKYLLQPEQQAQFRKAGLTPAHAPNG
ncbi:substrate-binding domain-containing protein [Saccharomonospora viridis]|uniref:substrate-binding domain-containing protein n=1 Tax=Saccharomonospora viridis TaxID=1852 RepID=UPI0024A94F6A|nr:substrate-binding domain-containing protein [Saccharomonospora viridis]